MPNRILRTFRGATQPPSGLGEAIPTQPPAPQQPRQLVGPPRPLVGPPRPPAGPPPAAVGPPRPLVGPPAPRPTATAAAPSTPPSSPAPRPAASPLRGGRGVAQGMLAATASDGGTADSVAQAAMLSPSPHARAAGAAWLGGQFIGDKINSKISPEMGDLIGGTINEAVRTAGRGINRGLRAVGVDTEFGSNWGEDDSAYLRDRAMARQADPSSSSSSSSSSPRSGGATAQPRGGYQAQRLAELGVSPEAQAAAPLSETDRRQLLRSGGGTPGQFVNLGTYGGDANIYGTASEPGGRINSFVGVGPNATRETEMDRNVIEGLRSPGQSGGRSDDQNGRRGGPQAFVIGDDSGRRGLERELRRIYSAPRAQGNLARQLMALESLRSGEQQAMGRDAVTMRGQDLAAETQRRGQDMTMDQRMQQDITRALTAAQQAGREAEEKGFSRYTEAISRMFADDPNPAARQEEFTSFLEGSDPEAYEKFSSMSPQDQMATLQNFKLLFDMVQERNRTALRGGGGTTNRADLPKEVREAAWSDVWNDNLPFRDYLWAQWTPFTNPNVVIGETGQPVLLSDLATDEQGEWDLDRLNLIEQRTGRRGLRDETIGRR